MSYGQIADLTLTLCINEWLMCAFLVKSDDDVHIMIDKNCAKLFLKIPFTTIEKKVSE